MPRGLAGVLLVSGSAAAAQESAAPVTVAQARSANSLPAESGSPTAQSSALLVAGVFAAMLLFVGSGSLLELKPLRLMRRLSAHED